MTRNFRVSSDGSLALPLLQQKIRVAGKEPQEIETDLKDALVREQLLVNPVVSVAVVEYRSVPVSVTGAVKRPLTFQAIGNVTLLDALTRAEGLSAEAGSEILISRPSLAPNAGAPVQRVPVKGLLDNADPSLNLRLYGGEEIRVPAAGRAYVLGAVKKSGSFPLSGSETTVLKLMILSEGLMPNADRRAFIYRTLPGKIGRQEIPIEIKGILERRSPDVPVIENDIIFVPGQPGKRSEGGAVEGRSQ